MFAAVCKENFRKCRTQDVSLLWFVCWGNTWLGFSRSCLSLDFLHPLSCAMFTQRRTTISTHKIAMLIIFGVKDCIFWMFSVFFICTYNITRFGGTLGHFQLSSLNPAKPKVWRERWWRLGWFQSPLWWVRVGDQVYGRARANFEIRIFQSLWYVFTCLKYFFC